MPSYVLLALSVGMPLFLVGHSIFATREMNAMRSIFLRERAASIAARLEVMPRDQVTGGRFDDLVEGDPALLGIRVFRPDEPQPGNSALEALRSGRELYSTEEVWSGGQKAFRAYVPFHSGSEVDVAQVDLRSTAPDFILVHARHNQLLAILSGSVLLLVSLYAVWTTRRAARLERQRVEMDSLAQLGQLSAVLAHEIRNPLGAIKGFAQLARENTEPAKLKPLDAIVRESKRLENLVNSLLLYGRPVSPLPRTFEWGPLAAELETHAKAAIGVRPIRFLSDSQIRTLSTDPDLLKQVLQNLIRNAIEAIPDSAAGEVCLHAAARDGGVVIAVEDNGPGIPDAVRAKLFLPFFTTKALGTGLGLAISKKVIEILGGSLQLLPLMPHGTRAEVALYGTHSGN